MERVDDGLAEIKRMYVRPEARGRGIGRRLLEAVESLAREAGYHRVRLDTMDTSVEARQLYRSAGYVEVEAFNDNPYIASGSPRASAELRSGHGSTAERYDGAIAFYEDRTPPMPWERTGTCWADTPHLVVACEPWP